MTEKFYNALLFNTVPIVFGGANYSAVAPKDSYIDVRDFPSGNSYTTHFLIEKKNCIFILPKSATTCRVSVFSG